MTAYAISEVHILDPDAADRYRDLAAASIRLHGGEYLVRAAVPQAAEGEWPQEARLVLVQFPTSEQLMTWYHSDDYAEALTIRETALSRRLLFVDGVVQP